MVCATVEARAILMMEPPKTARADLRVPLRAAGSYHSVPKYRARELSGAAAYPLRLADSELLQAWALADLSRREKADHTE